MKKRPQPKSELPREPFVTDVQTGLSLDAVKERISRGEVNGEQDVKTKSVGQILRENVLTFFNFVFVALAIILCCFSDWDNFFGAIGNFGFMGLVVFNTLLGTIQELRAKRTIDKLSLISAPKVKALRDGKECEIAVKDIVLDELVILETGSQICADAEVKEGAIEVNESLITGEPDAIHKQAGDKLLSGSFVVSGKAKAQVEHIGLENFATKISAGAKYFKKPNSEIWRSLMLIVKIMAAIIVPLGVALFFVKYYVQSSGSVNFTVQTVIGSVVGMIPSGLVALSSTVFCVSVVRLTRHKTLAQDMYCVETLARVDVLCLDKTGTITEGAMDLNDIMPLHSVHPNDLKQILKNLTTVLEDDNATANAIRQYVEDLEPNYRSAKTTVPFSSIRKWSGARIDGVSYVLGAPEFILTRPLKRVSEIVEKKAAEGYRVMMLSSTQAELTDAALPKSLKPICLLFITDRIRKEAPETLKFFKEEGVELKIISGDNPVTVRAVAMRAGLTDCDNIIDMSTLKTDEEVIDAATKYTIFGRVLPNQKQLLVSALKAAGHTVAMTGDGVNDVLALKTADCSIAMASGSDAAKNVSSLVLLNSNFASMPKVVAEGRRSINNLERAAALYLMKTVYNTLLAILFMCVPESLPFTPQNLTLMGALTIGVPSVVLALEPNKERVKGCFLPKVLANALPGGITVLFAGIAVLVATRYFLTGLDERQIQQLYIVIISFVGFMMLTKVCLPITPLHAVILTLMLGAFVCCYAVPLPKDFLIEMFGLSKNFTWEMGKTILIVCAVLMPTYVGMSYLAHFINKRFGDFWNDKFSRLDMFLRKSQQKAKA